MLRALGAIRLSRKTDESTSPERQAGRINWWISGNEAELVEVSEDLDVSGKVSPFDREDLGPWLTDPDKIKQWDVLVAWKLDRISRNALDTLTLLKWCEDHGKRIVCVDDMLDSGTKMGKMWIQLAAIFAEVDLSYIEERTNGSREELRQQGRWPGGHTPYGFKAVKVQLEDGTGWKLEHHPVHAEIVNKMADWVIDDESYRGVALRLNNEGIPSPRKSKNGWGENGVKQVLENPTVRWGKARHNGIILEAVDYAEPLLGIKKVMDLDRAMTKRAKVRSGRGAKKGLTGIVWCGKCESKYYESPTGKGTSYYRCAGKNQYQNGCENTSVSSELLTKFVMDEFEKRTRGEQMYERIADPGDDHTAELDSVKGRIAKLAAMFESGQLDESDTDFVSSLAALRRKRDELEKKPKRPARVDWVETGVEFPDVWNDYSPTERRAYMITRGVQVVVNPAPKGTGLRDRVDFTMPSKAELGEVYWNPRREDAKNFAFA